MNWSKLHEFSQRRSHYLFDKLLRNYVPFSRLRLLPAKLRFAGSLFISTKDSAPSIKYQRSCYFYSKSIMQFCQKLQFMIINSWQQPIHATKSLFMGCKKLAFRKQPPYCFSYRYFLPPDLFTLIIFIKFFLSRLSVVA